MKAIIDFFRYVVSLMITYFGFGLMIAFFIYIFMIMCSCTPVVRAEEEPVDITCIDSSFTIEKFVFELHVQGVECPDVVLRQACLESGFFTSDVWLLTNNPFGFYYKGEYLVFDDYRDAVGYYVRWQSRWYKGGDYYQFLHDVGYAEDSLYLSKVKNINLNNLR